MEASNYLPDPLRLKHSLPLPSLDNTLDIRVLLDHPLHIDVEAALAVVLIDYRERAHRVLPHFDRLQAGQRRREQVPQVRLPALRDCKVEH